jgi:hypothetical protein
MPVLLIRHRVADYETWERLFIEHDSTRRAYGCQGGRLFRSSVDPNETLTLLEWDDLGRARLFAQSDDLLDVIRRAGVADKPDLWLLNESDLSPGRVAD